MRARKNNIFSSVDWVTVLIYVLIVLFGWVNIYAATYDPSSTSVITMDSQHGRQLIWIGISFALALIILLIDAHIFSTAAYVIYAIAIVLLLVVLSMTAVKGATSWIPIGPLKLQPSEIAKFATALAIAKYLGSIDIHIRDLKTKVITFALIIVPAVLILLQHDAGSAIVFSSFIVPMYRLGLSGKVLIIGILAVMLFVLSLLINPYLLIGIIAALALAYLFLWLNKRTSKIIVNTILVVIACSAFVLSTDFVFEHALEEHQKTRINALLGKIDDPQGIEYNVRQSKIAIGSGGFLGKGFLNGTQTKFNFVPEQETDFIFCTVGEEWGLVGSALLVALYVILFIRLINKAERQYSKFALVYGYSVVGILLFHFIINLGMVLGLLPVIGVPLPFFSYGGSSLMSFTALLFVFLRQDASHNIMI
ncbi:MAG: rod shape-determining protein RodA [Bacteroidales bacterium]|nr:rod shape-determining protein RodA [Bacteroidales bacterium]